uniref:AlNc14C260G9787 protein n=1 Tax=Albugo laibachii Nc14 TaxID=890382 RepID=F0WTW3_9STRA|nr:AlNc14C260G9787 [Albugo laibachii Nc14]|eukprot:CCA24807.1 AlNc14C260G9787 [Albugo laibachii Nc14]
MPGFVPDILGTLPRQTQKRNLETNQGIDPTNGTRNMLDCDYYPYLCLLQTPLRRRINKRKVRMKEGESYENI